MLDHLLGYVGLSATGIAPLALLAAGGAIMLAYTVFGITGFGAAIVAMPLLTQVIPLHRAVAIMLLCDLVSGLLVGATSRRAVYLPELRRIVPWMLLGMLFGLGLLLWAPERPLLILLGAGVLGYSLWRLCTTETFRPLTTKWAIPFGVGGGSFTAMFGTGGPLYTIYLAGRLRDRNQLRATVGTLVMLSAFTRLIMFTATGLLLHREVFALVAWMLPCSLAGLRCGTWLRHRLRPAYISRLLWTILMLGSISLLIRALMR